MSSLQIPCETGAATMLLPGPATRFGTPPPPFATRTPVPDQPRLRVNPFHSHTLVDLSFFWFFILLLYNYSYIVVRPKKRHITVTWTPAKGGSIPNTPANSTGPGRGGIPAILNIESTVYNYFSLRYAKETTWESKAGPCA